MFVSAKDGARLFGMTIMTLCAAFICTMFANYRWDLALMDTPEGTAGILYDAQLATANVIMAVAGGCLVGCSVIVLFFQIRTYIQQHRQEIGILKALGYGNMRIAVSFWAFALSALLGLTVGNIIGFGYLEPFYETMNADGLLPEVTISIHWDLIIYVVVLPTILFSFISMIFALNQVRHPVLSLLRSLPETSAKNLRRHPVGPFLKVLRRSQLASQKGLIFYIFFGAFCFASMLQMAPSMQDMASKMMGALMLILGLVLAFTSLILAAGSAVRSAGRTLSLLHALGYTAAEERSSVLSIYRPFAYFGFAVGTVYQYMLLRLMLDVFYADFPDIPEYSFDVSAFFIVLASFVLVYEILMRICARRMKALPLRQFMME